MKFLPTFYYTRISASQLFDTTCVCVSRTTHVTEFQQSTLARITNRKQLGHAFRVAHAVRHDASILQTVSLDAVALLHQTTPQFKTFTALERSLRQGNSYYIADPGGADIECISCSSITHCTNDSAGLGWCAGCVAARCRTSRLLRTRLGTDEPAGLGRRLAAGHGTLHHLTRRWRRTRRRTQ